MIWAEVLFKAGVSLGLSGALFMLVAVLTGEQDRFVLVLGIVFVIAVVFILASLTVRLLP